ncbi:hypothetical protein C8A01DRAFT_40803 [Parachaetomium inaequale]|uniref:Uncharacterized protein n=1 Tax=Parachaetomium inaequale TaxID=2588326 RepID=A0AAN6SLG0_9PEZI|nr:hypothetical protein C8A01DRAFT_40803 [Parachaetomium inaequale]
MSTTAPASGYSWSLRHVPQTDRVKLISPTLHTAEHEHAWRRNLNSVWRFINFHWDPKNKRGPYNLSVNMSCRTNLRLDMPAGSGLRELKRLPQAVDYFGPTLKAHLPIDHLGEKTAVRNPASGKTAAIEACKSEQAVAALMNPNGTRYLGFNFSTSNPTTIAMFTLTGRSGGSGSGGDRRKENKDNKKSGKGKSKDSSSNKSKESQTARTRRLENAYDEALRNYTATEEWIDYLLGLHDADTRGEGRPGYLHDTEQQLQDAYGLLADGTQYGHHYCTVQVPDLDRPRQQTNPTRDHCMIQFNTW